MADFLENLFPNLKLLSYISIDTGTNAKVRNKRKRQVNTILGSHKFLNEKNLYCYQESQESTFLSERGTNDYLLSP